jgi:hypothetical protein
MKSKPFWTLAVMVLTGLGWMAVPVQGEEQQQPPAFSDVDKDKNGYISADESVGVPGLSEQLTQLDRNSDGKISKTEYEALTSGTPGAGEEGGATPRTEIPRTQTE